VIRAVRRLVVVAAVTAPFGAVTARAQVPQGITLRLDNDAFDFWMQPYNRPDEEYTSGVRLTYDGAVPPWWFWSFLSGGPACAYRVQACRSARAELGQDIYTPSTSVNDPRASQQSRANGGWLYIAHTARALRAARADEFTVTLGVTGSPSLARFTQDVFHNILPEFNRPTDWTRQIRFEPGAVLGYAHHERIAALELGPIGFDMLPSVSVEAGNVTTRATAELRSRLGWNVPHPWLPTKAPASIVVSGGVSGHAVARDIFLDGNTVDPQYRVGHEPFVGSGEASVELRVLALSASYRVVTDSRAYPAGPKWHPWASLIGGVTFAR
jgi:hypothetical protein